jgi:hypothetical protein
LIVWADGCQLAANPNAASGGSNGVRCRLRNNWPLFPAKPLKLHGTLCRSGGETPASYTETSSSECIEFEVARNASGQI